MVRSTYIKEHIKRSNFTPPHGFHHKIDHQDAGFWLPRSSYDMRGRSCVCIWRFACNLIISMRREVENTR